MTRSGLNAHQIKRCCERKLGISFRSGRHFTGWFKLGKIKVARLTVPMGRKSIPPKTYKTMANQLKLNIRQFDELLECPLDKEKYVEIVTKNT